jgi:hypothetical protein
MKLGILFFLIINCASFAQPAQNHLFELAVSSRTKNTDVLRTRPLCLEFGKSYQAFRYSAFASSYIQSFSVYYHYENNLKGQNSHGIGYALYSVGKDDPNSVFFYQRLYLIFAKSSGYQQYSWLIYGENLTGIGYAIDQKQSILCGLSLNDNWKPYLALAYHHVFYVPKSAFMTHKMKIRRATKCSI